MNVLKISSKNIIDNHTVKIFGLRIRFENLNFKNELFIGIDQKTSL